jgi:hypothetical protein
MYGEETGRPCRHEVSGRPARPNRGVSTTQVDGVNAVGVHPNGEMNRNTRLRARISTKLPFRSILGESAEVPTAILHPLSYSDGGSAEPIRGDTF